jgi:hypothetical protein
MDMMSARDEDDNIGTREWSTLAVAVERRCCHAFATSRAQLHRPKAVCRSRVTRRWRRHNPPADDISVRIAGGRA